MPHRSGGLAIVIGLAIAATFLPAAEPAAEVTLLRVPHEGVQPQVVVSEQVVHLIYLRGAPEKSDVEYVRSADGGRTFSAPLTVNSQAGSAVALGSVRGAHLALGRAGRVHVAWMGSGSAEPRAPGGATPMLYARQSAASDGFEPQRNLIQSRVGLDGGGSLAADAQGRVYVAWHAPDAAGGTETERRVWVAASDDQGATFAAEQPASSAALGACGCCGMRVLAAADRKLWISYRAAGEHVHRDMTILQWDPKTGDSRIAQSDPLQASTCPMSTTALAAGPDGWYAAWETNGQIYWTAIDSGSGKALRPIALPGAGGNRKHPALAVNGQGQLLLAWAEDTGWNRGGTVAWQVFDAQRKPIRAARGRAEPLPVWSLPAAFALPDNSFRVLY